MIEWAKKEIEIACKKERGDGDPDGWDYGVACYESALKAFESLCDDGHSRFSIGMTKNILNRLIDGKPLTPIEDTDDIWNEYSVRGGSKHYQCKRMSSLFKDVDDEGNVTYTDVNRIVCVDIYNPNNTYYNGFVAKIISEIEPITMPYMPLSKPIRVYCEELLTDPKNGDFDSIGIKCYAKPNEIDPYNVVTCNVNRYFKGVIGGWEEISSEKWWRRKAKHLDRLEKLEEERRKDNDYRPDESED